jgi:hypothetical protein
MTAESASARFVTALTYMPGRTKPDCHGAVTLQHVPGAVNIPDSAMECRKLKPHAGVKFYVEHFR